MHIELLIWNQKLNFLYSAPDGPIQYINQAKKAALLQAAAAAEQQQQSRELPMAMDLQKNPPEGEGGGAGQEKETVKACALCSFVNCLKPDLVGCPSPPPSPLLADLSGKGGDHGVPTIW